MTFKYKVNNKMMLKFIYVTPDPEFNTREAIGDALLNLIY